MIKIQLSNACGLHDFLLESFILNYHHFTKKRFNDVLFYIDRPNNTSKDSLAKYILNKYKNVVFDKCPTYDFFIDLTYSSKYTPVIKDDRHFYISHFWNADKHFNGLYYLSPLAEENIFTDIVLPFKDRKRNTSVPVFTLQGTISQSRRKFTDLVSILQHDYDRDFRIKFIGKGGLPGELLPYKDKIELYSNLNFVDYHLEMLDCFCMFTLTSPEVNFSYYTGRITSSIIYSQQYSDVCLIDEQLNSIYKLPNAVTYTDNIQQQFSVILNSFYEQ